jgi:hypothetical protein
MTPSPASHPDALLLDLALEFDRLYAAWRPLHDEANRLNDGVMDIWRKRWARGVPIDDISAGRRGHGRHSSGGGGKGRGPRC